MKYAWCVLLVLAACGYSGLPPNPGDAGGGGDAPVAGAPGTLLMAKQFSGPGNESASLLAVDAAGNIFLGGGLLNSDVNFGCAQHAAATGSLAFVVKLDKAGACQWVVTGNNRPFGLVVANGKVFLAGDTIVTGAATIGGMTIPTVGNSGSAFFAQLDAATGSVDYVRHWGGTAGAGAFSVSVNSAGDVIVGGTWTKATANEVISVTGQADTITLSSLSLQQQFGVVVAYSPAGEPQWGKALQCEGSASVFKVQVDPNDDILVAGGFNSDQGIEGPTGFVMSKLGVTGNENTYFMKITGTGQLGRTVWTKAWGSPVSDIEPQAIAADASGGDAVAFFSFEAQDLGGGNGPFAGGTDMDIGIYDGGGNYRSGGTYGGPSSDSATGMVFSPSGGHFLTGFGSAINFSSGGGPLIGFGNEDIFIAAFDANNAYRWALSYGSSNDDAGLAVALGPQGLVVTATTGGTLNVGDQHFNGAGTEDILLLVLQP